VIGKEEKNVASFSQIVLSESELRSAMKAAYAAGFSEAQSAPGRELPSQAEQDLVLDNMIAFIKCGHKSDPIKEAKKK